MNRSLRPRTTTTSQLVSVTPAKNGRKPRLAATEARLKLYEEPEIIVPSRSVRRTKSQGRSNVKYSPPKRRKRENSSSCDDNVLGSESDDSLEFVDENISRRTRSSSRGREPTQNLRSTKRTFEPMEVEESAKKSARKTQNKAKTPRKGRQLFQEEEENLVEVFESSMRGVQSEARTTRSRPRDARTEVSAAPTTSRTEKRRRPRKVLAEVQPDPIDVNMEREGSSSPDDDDIPVLNIRKKLTLNLVPITPEGELMKTHVTPIRIKITRTPGGTKKLQTMKPGQRLNTFEDERRSLSPIRIKIKLPSEEDTLKKLATKLHLSEVPKALPCREAEAKQLRQFLRESIDKKYGESGAMYISGVPGTGKTATVRTVIEAMKNDKACPRFVYVEVSAMIFRKKVFVEIYNGIQEELSKERRNCATPAARIAPATARQKLNTMLKQEDRTRPPIVILVDELDGLCNKKQDVLYDIFDWTALPESRVTIVAIANTLDFPERMLCQRILSRLDKRRLIFQPYEHAQIEKIIDARLSGSKAVAPEAVQLCAKKVASISGDLRQALDMLRRAIRCAVEEGAKQLTINHVLAAQKAVTEPFRIRLVKGLRVHKFLLFRSVLTEIQSAGSEETVYANVYKTYSVLCATLNGLDPCSDGEAYEMLLGMARCSLVVLASGQPDMLRRRIRLGMAVYEAEACVKAVEDKKKTLKF